MPRRRAERKGRRRRREQASTTITPARPGVSAVASGFLSALSALARAGVDFVLVGVGGINFYARDPSEAVVTLDRNDPCPCGLVPNPAALRARLRM